MAKGVVVLDREATRETKVWRATVHVNLENSPWVTGECTPDGPWIRGEGQTQEIALRRMYENIGRAYLHSLDAQRNT